jgi:hypothetical protein
VFFPLSLSFLYSTARISGQNVKFSNVKITNSLMKEGAGTCYAIGALTGRIDAGCSLTIENCEVSGSIEFANKGTQYIGGLMGWIQSGASLTITNSTADVDIKGKNYCGGLIGYNDGGTYEVDNKSTFTGTITCPGANKGDVISNP